MPACLPSGCHMLFRLVLGVRPHCSPPCLRTPSQFSVSDRFGAPRKRPEDCGLPATAPPSPTSSTPIGGATPKRCANKAKEQLTVGGIRSYGRCKQQWTSQFRSHRNACKSSTLPSTRSGGLSAEWRVCAGRRGRTHHLHFQIDGLSDLPHVAVTRYSRHPHYCWASKVRVVHTSDGWTEYSNGLARYEAGFIKVVDA
jgi:hypothetical protein